MSADMHSIMNDWRGYLNEQSSYNMHDRSNRPKAFIVPHASEEYSGYIAIEVLKKIPSHDYDSIVILGIDHDSNDVGVYVGSDYNPDKGLISMLLDAGMVEVEGDHSIGHIIPLIERYSDLPICPIVVRHTTDLVTLLKDIITEDILVIASTDMSHYHNVIESSRVDIETIRSIQQHDGNVDMCGYHAVKVLIDLFDEPPQLVDYTNSSHLEGDTEKVVGYAALQVGGFSSEILNAKTAVESFIDNQENVKFHDMTDEIASFIGISRYGELQGSMGQIRPVMPYGDASVQAFVNTLGDSRMTYNSDDIFIPGSEFAVKIRLLSELESTKLNDIIIGIDGMVIESGNRSAIFLPEVPTKQNWDLETYLVELKQKAEITTENFNLFKFQTEALMFFT